MLVRVPATKEQRAIIFDTRFIVAIVEVQGNDGGLDDEFTVILAGAAIDGRMCLVREQYEAVLKVWEQEQGFA